MFDVQYSKLSLTCIYRCNSFYLLQCIFILVPPQRDETLPDLHRLLDSLEDGKTDLETKEDPPALFTGPTHIPHFTKISGMFVKILYNLSSSWKFHNH